MKADSIVASSKTRSGAPIDEANLEARFKLMSALSARIQSWGITQEAAACRLGIARPRLNNLLRGKIARFSLDALLNLAIRSGLSVRIEIAEGAIATESGC